MPEVVLLVEDLGRMSVTNDADNVVALLWQQPETTGRRYYYRDSEGDWAELIHIAGTFTGFKFIGSMELEKLLTLTRESNHVSAITEAGRENRHRG